MAVVKSAPAAPQEEELVHRGVSTATGADDHPYPERGSKNALDARRWTGRPTPEHHRQRDPRQLATLGRDPLQRGGTQRSLAASQPADRTNPTPGAGRRRLLESAQHPERKDALDAQEGSSRRPTPDLRRPGFQATQTTTLSRGGSEFIRQAARLDGQVRASGFLDHGFRKKNNDIVSIPIRFFLSK